MYKQNGKKLHTVKIQEKHWERVEEGSKKFEIRFNDRDYQTSDEMQFKVIERDMELQKPIFEITHVFSDLNGEFGLEKGFVILSIVRVMS